LSFDEKVDYARSLYGKEDWWNINDSRVIEILQSDKRAISLMFNMRSNDVPLGLPFNIASYALLLEIIGKIVNMVPDELIGNLGDCHIYLNQIEGVKEQICREPLELPTLKLPKTDAFWNGFDVSLFGHLEPSDFQIEGYKSHPSIKIPLSN
jgi:thymidylate synthase